MNILKDKLNQANESIQQCTNCNLHKLEFNIKNTDLGYGKLYGKLFGQNPILFLVGENPSYRRYKMLEHAFGGDRKVGGTGDKFVEILEETEILQYCYITNLVKCSVKNNKITNSDIDLCKHWLDNEIKTINPKIIIGLGAISYKYLAENYSNVIKAYHPNYYISYNKNRINEYKDFWKLIKERYIV